jgi:hypothetical protein
MFSLKPTGLSLTFAFFGIVVNTCCRADDVRMGLKTMDEVLNAKITVDFNEGDWVPDAETIQKQVTAKYRVSFPFRITPVIRDLQNGGITKNAQARRFTVRDMTLAEVLTTYVARRNPYTLVRSLADKDQQLVWLIATDKKSILITTRNAAKSKSNELPSVFRSHSKRRLWTGIA